ncbi:MAG: hypothetical protein KIS92_20680 [Planctomycetota bacterium]|nr:hypothetical protein [Planctomycetota bacterium]
MFAWALVALVCAGALRAADEPRPDTAQTLPDGTFLYVRIGAWNTWANDWDKTSLSNICAEPGVRAFIAGPLDKLSGLLNQAIGGANDGAEPKKADGQPEEAVTVGGVFRKVGQVLPGPTTLVMKYSKDDQANKRPPSVALVLGVKDLGQDLQRAIDGVLKKMTNGKELSTDRWTRRIQFIFAEINDMLREGTGTGIVDEKHGDATMRILPIGKFTITMTLFKDSLILSSDKELCAQLLDGLAGTLPTNLAQDKTYASCGLSGQEHLAAYLDVKGLREALSLESAAPKIKEMLAKAGLDELRAVAWSLRMRGPAFESRTAVVSDAKRTGVLGSIDSEPLSLEALKVARADAPEMVALRVKPAELFPIVRGMLQSTTGPETTQRFEGAAKKMAEEGKDLSKALAEAFTGELVITRYSAKATPLGALSTELGSASVKDAAKAEALMVDLIKRMVALRQPAEKFEDVYKELEYEGAKICYVTPPAGSTGLPPVFARLENRILVALDMETLRAAIKDLKTPGLADAEGFKSGLEPSKGALGSAVYYNDWRQRYLNIFDVGAKTLKLAASLDLLRTPGIDVNLLPAPESVSKHLFPSLTNIQATESALVITSHSPLPSPEVIGPPLAACATVIATFIPESKPEPAPAEPAKEPAKEDVKKAE